VKPVLMAIWLLHPCDSTVVTDHAARTTTVIACPDTFGEAAGPFLAEGWKPPPPVQKRAEVRPKKKKKRKRRS
jgi:hypothetical protein